MRRKFKSINKLYHYTKLDTAIKILETNCLRFGRLCDMNDIHENDKLSYCDVAGNPIHDFSYDILDEIDSEIAKYRQISFTVDDDKQETFGFDLHQMWGLYADKGQGICLVFDKDSLCETIDADILNKAVSYDTSIESFYITSVNRSKSIQLEIQEQAEKLFFRKRKEWEHEQEYRFLKRCPDLNKEEYLDYGEALKYIILNSVNENVDDIVFHKKLEVAHQYANKVPILVYGNGLFDYSLLDINHKEIIWTSSNGYDILIPGENCEIDF